MKALVGGILIGFALLMSATAYVAQKSYDGPVEKDYYRKSLDYFKEREGPGGIHSGPVAGAAGSQPVLMEIFPKPVRAMRELSFTVELPGFSGPGPPRIELAMPGMRMGRNGVDLAPDGPGRYRGKGVIVRCASGRRTWTAEVAVPGKGTARFTFDVAD